MKLYTRGGDTGDTFLCDGRRVHKDDPRVAAYGGVDELNSALGLAAVACGDEVLLRRLRVVQNDLLCMGSDLATPQESTTARARVPTIRAEQVTQLERWIDEASEAVPGLRNFIVPCGSEAACRFHLARTICRRAERAVVSLIGSGQAVNEHVLVYLNRLSDLLFAWARLANHRAGVEDVVWHGGAGCV